MYKLSSFSSTAAFLKQTKSIALALATSSVAHDRPPTALKVKYLVDNSWIKARSALPHVCIDFTVLSENRVRVGRG